MTLKRFFPCSLFCLCLLMTPAANGANDVSAGPEPLPPGPPLMETFQASPQLSLFPRLGDFRPEDGAARLPFWKTYREHLLKISGVVEVDPGTGNRAFSFRGIKGIDSLGHFAPLAVAPDTRYRLTLKLNVDLLAGATAGIGVLEFREFIWVGEQYPQSLHQEYFLAASELLRLAQSGGWREYALPFTTGPETRMIHLVLFREGPADRRPVLIDDISISVE